MDRLIVDLVHGITSPDPETRDRSADAVTDVQKGLLPEDVAVLAHALIAARMVEVVPTCQEAQLHALAELAAWHDLPTEGVRRLALLRPASNPSQAEYLNDLLGD